MSETKLDSLIKAVREDRFNAFRYLVLASAFEDEGKTRCGRNQHDITSDFCCAEWAYMRAWVLWPREIEKDDSVVVSKGSETGKIQITALDDIEDGIAEDEMLESRSSIPALELNRIRKSDSKTRLLEARLQELDAPEDRFVTEIIEELAVLGHPDAVGPLLVQFSRPDVEVHIRAAAAKALAAIGDPVVIPTLIRHVAQSGSLRITSDQIYRTSLSDLLSGDHEQKQAYLLAEVILALGTFGDPKAVRSIRSAMQSQYTAVREAATIALGRIGGEEAEQTLARRTGDRKTRVVRAAQAALSQLENPEAHASMIIAEFLKDPTRSPDATARVLLECGSVAITMILELLPGAEGKLLELGKKVLSNISEPDALEEMLAALEDPDPAVRALVAELIAGNPHRLGRAVAVLKHLRESDSEESVREAADAAIEKIMKGMF